MCRQTYQCAVTKELTVSIDKSKTIVFNNTGKLGKECFRLNEAKLEPVHRFCYIGFEVTASGTVKNAIHTLHDKANKAVRPLLCAISRFNIPVNTAMSLSHNTV